ncbi:MAG TPA: SHOCT domain-containing protein, partial [Ktedonobacteraceae bacterium]|nr:SHOCT domain-containing protein [Ktedonobacteraceae bacterium]
MPGYGHHWMHGHHWMYGHAWGGGFFGGPGLLLSVLGMLFWIALLIGIAWAIVGWLLPAIRPLLKDVFGGRSNNVPALEILRRRYAAGEIDSITFEQMWER